MTALDDPAVLAALDANHEAWRLLSSGASPVMAVFAVPSVFASGPGAGDEAERWEQVLWGSWLGALTDGEVVLPFTRLFLVAQRR